MAITTRNIKRLYSVFRFLSIDYFKENKRYSLEMKPKPEEESFFGVVFEQIHVFDLTDKDIEEINSIRIIGKGLLIDAEDELRSNLYSIDQEDRMDYLNKEKDKFYFFCVEIDDIFLNLYKHRQIHIVIDEKEHIPPVKLYDEYFIEISNISYEWAYILSGFDSDTITQRYKIPKGKYLNKNHIYNVLYPNTNHNNTEEENKEKPTPDTKEIESFFSNKDYWKIQCALTP